MFFLLGIHMQNNVVKNVLAALFLVVLCFVVGVHAAESAVTSVGIIAAIVGIVFLLWIGPRCWALIYLLPPVMSLLPLPGKLATLPVAFVVCSGILVYWLLMWLMGYVKFKWRSLLVLDLLVCAIAIYMVVSYYRNPVSVGVLDDDAETVGGKEYIWCIVATMYYLAVSAIPATYEQLRKVMDWAVKLVVGFSVLAIVLSLAGIRGGVSMSQLADAATTSRFTMFAPLGMYCIYILYGQNPLLKVLFSPTLLVGLFLSFCAILISGWREVLMANGFIIAALAFVKRELWALVLLGLLAYGGLLFLSTEGIVKQLPYGMQRCLSVAPGVEIERDIKEETRHSSEWRVEMWRWALDPRTAYIKDYTWGDGFGQSVDYMRRERRALMRGETRYGDQDYFARTGTWHSGYITTIHRLGYVGLVILSLTFLCGIVLMFRTCSTLRGTPLYLPCLFFAIPFAGQPGLFFISAGTITTFFSTYTYLAAIKLFYCVGREQGLIAPLWHRRQYVPQVIREHGDELQSA